MQALQQRRQVAVQHVDLAGVKQVRQSRLECVVVWVTAPSETALRERPVQTMARAKE